MKVFKFYSENLFYAYSGNNEQEAKDSLLEEVGDITIDKAEEIPEREWDKKIISVWEDNDFDKEPYKESIRDIMVNDSPQMIYSNDFSLF